MKNRDKLIDHLIILIDQMYIEGLIERKELIAYFTTLQLIRGKFEYLSK